MKVTAWASSREVITAVRYPLPYAPSVCVYSGPSQLPIPRLTIGLSSSSFMFDGSSIDIVMSTVLPPTFVYVLESPVFCVASSQTTPPAAPHVTGVVVVPAGHGAAAAGETSNTADVSVTDAARSDITAILADAVRMNGGAVMAGVVS